MTDNNTTKTEEVIAPKKRKALVEYLGVLFAVAFLLVAVSLLVKVNSMQEDMDAAASGARENIEAMEQELETARREKTDLEEQLQRSAKAGDLLAMAQEAYYKKDKVRFHSAMAELEGYAGALPEEASKIYTNLTDHLQ